MRTSRALNCINTLERAWKMFRLRFSIFASSRRRQFIEVNFHKFPLLGELQFSFIASQSHVVIKLNVEQHFSDFIFVLSTSVEKSHRARRPNDETFCSAFAPTHLLCFRATKGKMKLWEKSEKGKANNAAAIFLLHLRFPRVPQLRLLNYISTFSS